MSGFDKDSDQAYHKATQPSQSRKRRSSGECAGTSTGGPTTATPPKSSRSSVTETHSQGQGAAVVSSKRYIYVFGGDAVTEELGSVACYDIQENKWQIKEKMMPISGYGSAAAWFRGKIYLAGGIIGDYAINCVSIYDPKTDSWKTGTPMSGNRAFHGLIEHANKLYAIGGFTHVPEDVPSWAMVVSSDLFDAYDKYQDCCHRDKDARDNPYYSNLRTKRVLKSVESFNGKEWEMCRPMSKERYAFGITLRDNCIYVAGGIRNTKISTIEYYDGQGIWRNFRPALYKEMAGCALSVIDGKFYVVGVGDTHALEISRYDAGVNKWVKISTIPPNRRDRRNSVIAVDGYNVYIMGGLRAEGQGQAIAATVEHMDRCNVRTGKWTPLNDMLYGRCGCPAVIADVEFD